MTTATARVLVLPELLSIIFTSLDFKELIRANHVCQAWKATITEDAGAQETLFLRTKPITRVIDPGQGSSRFARDPDRAPADCDIIVQVNPLLGVLQHDLDPEDGDPYADLISLDWKVRRPRQLFLDTRGMWRSMFVTQPPCKEFKPMKTAFGGFTREALFDLGMIIPDDDDVVRDEDGVRLGMVVDEFCANGWGRPGGHIFGCINEKSRVLDTVLEGSKTLAVRDGKFVRE